jgi:hypothetical protein
MSVHHMVSCVCSVLVLSIAVLVLVLEAIWYSNPAHWSASSREPPRSTIGIAAVQAAIEYEYRFTEYRFTEYENVEIRCTNSRVIHHRTGFARGLALAWRWRC